MHHICTAHLRAIREEIERVCGGQSYQSWGDEGGTIRKNGQRSWRRFRMGNRKFSKSELVQTALEEMLREYQQHRDDSRLYLRPIGPP